MKAFALSADQIALIAAGLAADELSSRFKRHVDFLTAASWAGDTPLGAGGMGIVTGAERSACARRIEAFFDAPPGVLQSTRGEKLSDWAISIAESVERRLETFSFTAAGRDSVTESSTHAAADVFADAAAAANLLYGRRRVVSLVSPHSLMGFVATALVANLQGAPYIDARLLAPEALAETLSFGDVLVATPTLWRYVVREGLTAPDNAVAVSFGEAMAPDLAADIRKCGFGALRELYGSTETGVVAWRDSPSEPFNLFDHWARVDGALTRRGSEGGGRPVEAMDVFEWAGERAFRLGGRRDGAVQIGAVNVFPDRVAAAIGAHRLVRACRVDVMRQRGGVVRLVAQIELKPGLSPGDSLAREIDAWCRAQLRPHERPRIYNYVDALEPSV